MKTETDPITDDEWLLRRVRIELFRNDQTQIISPDTFKPRLPGKKVRHPDTEGISLYRQACLESAEDILATVAENRRHEYGIVRIPVSLLKTLKLSVKISQDCIVGHVVIPELNATAYQENKDNFTSIKEQLATVASEETNILRRPTA